MNPISSKVAGTLGVRLPWTSGRTVGAAARSRCHRAGAASPWQGGTKPARARHAATLVELLVVIMIMLMITAITVPVIAPALKNRDVREAARMIDVYITGAKTRAKLAGHPVGVIFERQIGNPNACTTLFYCEQPDAWSGDTNKSTIRCLGNGGFGAWSPLGGVSTVDPAFPNGDLGWIQATVPGGYLTTLAPGDIFTVKGTQYRIWAGEPFADLNQDGICDAGDPFLDVDLSGSWTPPNPPPGQTVNGFTNIPGQPYVDPASGYFVQPNVALGGPFPQIVAFTQTAFITYCYADNAQAYGVMNSIGSNGGLPINIGPYTSMGTITPLSNPPTLAPNTAVPAQPFSFAGRPLKTSAPPMQLPGGAVIDFGANYPDAAFSIVVPIPGSGMEVLANNQNAAGWWSTFRANPALDPNIPNSLTSQGLAPADPTVIGITFQPDGSVDRVFSWSEANNTNTTMTTVNWTDWQGRIPAGPVYLLIGRAELVNGDPTLVPLIGQTPPVAPLKPIFNVQDPNSLWVTITPLTGAVSTAENVGFDLTQPIPTNAAITGQNAMAMQIYWAANVYYARRLARAMADMGGR